MHGLGGYVASASLYHVFSALTRQSRRIPQELALRAPSADVQIVAHKLAHAEQTKPSPLLATAQYLMAIVSLASVNQPLFLILPEPLNLGRLLILVPPVRSPASLDSRSHIVPVLVSHCFQGEQLHEGERRTRGDTGLLTVSGFLINALVTPICHSSLAMPVSLSIRSQPDRSSPVQM